MKKAPAKPADGPHKELFAGGELSGEGRFQNGKRNGHWEFYHRNGKLKAVGKYLDGELNGHWEWWRENGQPLQAGAFKNGKQDSIGPTRLDYAKHRRQFVTLS